MWREASSGGRHWELVQNGDESTTKVWPWIAKGERWGRCRVWEGCSRSSLGVSDGIGVGIWKIEEVEDGPLSIHMMNYTAMTDLMMNFNREVVNHMGTS